MACLCGLWDTERQKFPFWEKANSKALTFIHSFIRPVCVRHTDKGFICLDCRLSVWSVGHIEKRVSIVVDRFYISLFPALKQAHCARMWFYMSEQLFIVCFWISTEVVCLQCWHGWCHMKLLPSWRVLCTPYNHAPRHMQSHIRKVCVFSRKPATYNFGRMTGIFYVQLW